MKTDLKRGFIKEQIPKLDRIFVPQDAQREGVLKIYGADPEKITEVGMGYNSKVFFPAGEKKADGVTRIVFAGKIAEKKGVMSLIRSLFILSKRYGQDERCRRDRLLIRLAGSSGNPDEYEKIRKMAEECPYEVQFTGRLTQPELAKVYNESEIFVLPSFFDGLPLTIIEALACGGRAVVSDLPGIKDWVGRYTSGADVRYVRMPEMRNADEPAPESLPGFEERLADVLYASIGSAGGKYADVSRISWEGIAREVLK